MYRLLITSITIDALKSPAQKFYDVTFQLQTGRRLLQRVRVSRRVGLAVADRVRGQVLRLHVAGQERAAGSVERSRDGRVPVRCGQSERGRKLQRPGQSHSQIHAGWFFIIGLKNLLCILKLFF